MEAPLCEIVIGTNDDNEVAWEEEMPHPPTLAEVEEYVASLRAIVMNNDTPIEATSIHLIDTIVDHLDQMYYWAVEEGTTFYHQPSVLAQCDAPQLIQLCLMTGRPKIVTAALRVMRHLLCHEQAASHLLALFVLQKDAKSTVSTEKLDSKGFFGKLGSIMGLYAGLAELQSEATAVATEAAHADIEGLLESPVIGHILAALERHSGSTAMQTEGVRFFSTVVDIQRNAPCVDGTNDSQPTPVALLLTQFGVVVEFVVRVGNANVDNVEVKRNAVHFFLRCAAYPENLLLLMQCGVYPFLVNALFSATRVPELFVELTETIAHFISLLDPLQRRSLVLVIRRVLLEITSPFFVSLCVALIVRLLQTESKGDVVMDRHLRTASLQETQPAALVRVGLSFSETIRLTDDDIRVFMSFVSIPQLLCCAADTIGEEDPMLRRMVAEAMKLFSPYRWR